MTQWLSVLIGLVAGIVLIAVAAFFAFRPYLHGKPPNLLKSNPSDSPDYWGGYWPPENGGSHDSTGADGHGN